MFSFQNISLFPLLNPLLYVQDGLNRFHTFVHHPLFKKFPGEIQNAVDEFKSKNPKFIFPSNTGKVAGLVARIHDANKRTNVLAFLQKLSATRTMRCL